MAASSSIRSWVKSAIKIIESDFNRSADTHLIPMRLPAFPFIHLYWKDESSHPTGSLKVIETSSGSTAVSEAYFARLLNLPFIAVMPKSTSSEKIALIEFYGGRCHLVDDPRECTSESLRLARELHNAHFMDQFTFAEKATDWRSNNNIAESIYSQMREEPHPEPAWIVTGAGTGGTSATIGRYVRYTRRDTQVAVADPEHSVFFDHFTSAAGDRSITACTASKIEGIGRPRVEPSFVRDVVDTMVKVPDECSLAALHYLESSLGRRCGGSTGTNFCAVLSLALEMRRNGQAGSIVSILCDTGERYAHTYYDPAWLASHGFDAPKLAAMSARITSIASDPASAKEYDSWLEVVRKPSHG